MPRRSSNPLSEHVQRLQDEQARILREMAEAEKALRRKPKPSARPVAAPRNVRINNNVTAINLPRPKDHRFLGASGQLPVRRTGRRPKADARMAQIKFLILCLIFFGLLLFVWRNLPG